MAVDTSIETLLNQAAHAERTDGSYERMGDSPNYERAGACDARAELFEAMSEELRLRREPAEFMVAFPAPDTKDEPENVAIVHLAIERDGHQWRVIAKRGLDAEVCEGDTLPPLVSAAVIAVSVGSQTKPAPVLSFCEPGADGDRS